MPSPSGQVDPFDRLLTQMLSIARAVNEFKSESVQQDAFKAIIRALDLADTEERTPAVRPTLITSKRKVSATRRAASPASDKPDGAPIVRAKTRRVSATMSIDKSLNLRPSGTQSFADFVEAKQPTMDHERSLIAVYWITKIAELPAATIEMVYTCYKDRGWRIPSNLRTAIALTAYKKGWLDTSDMDDLKVAVHGENHVEHDLPAAKKASA